MLPEKLQLGEQYFYPDMKIHTESLMVALSEDAKKLLGHEHFLGYNNQKRELGPCSKR